MLDFKAGSAGKNLMQGRLLFHLHIDSKCDLVEESERKHSVIGIQVLLEERTGCSNPAFTTELYKLSPQVQFLYLGNMLTQTPKDVIENK